MAWHDFYKIFKYSFEDDPQSSKIRRRNINATGGGETAPDSMSALRSGMGNSSMEQGQLRLGSELIDVNNIEGRLARLKEYERLRSMPEIEQVMTVIADEACIGGDTPVATVYHGHKTIKWLTENIKDEFFVYCWDFEKNDYTIGIAYNPRVVKTAPTVKVLLDDGSHFFATYDHRVLLNNGAWVESGNLRLGDELTPFYRIPAKQELTKLKKNQFPRIYTKDRGWIHERQFIDEWRTGKSLPQYESCNRLCRLVEGGLSSEQITEITGHARETIISRLALEGFTTDEIRWLAKRSDRRRVLGIIPGPDMEVYDLSVKDHENFCGESIIFHNCQKDSEKNVLKITVKNEDVLKEIQFLMLHRSMLNMNKNLWGTVKRLCINGDFFYEIIIDLDCPKDGILKVQELPPQTVFRIQTSKDRLVEFQQGQASDYEILKRPNIEDTPENELNSGSIIRFNPEQIVHLRLGENRPAFWPYGQSLIEPARSPAHMLRLMEDAMVVYRLVRAPERRVFYIDVGNLPPYRAESLMSRMQDLLKKKKVVNRPGEGASAVDERWSSPSAEEDFFVPVRTGGNTRIETLPGASNLGEIDDTVYFRNKLYLALNFPENYVSGGDASVTRITASAQNVKFARMLERIQECVEDGLWEIADRHLKLRGYPEESYEDLKISLNIPSEYRELSRMEIETNRINNAIALKGSMLYSDFDVLTKVMKYTEEEANDIVERSSNQKMQEARLQVLVANPTLMGFGSPGGSEDQMGVEPGGPNPMLPPDGAAPTPPPEGGGEGAAPPSPEGSQPPQGNYNAQPLEKPSDEDIKRYDLEIQNYAADQDHEDIDFSEE